MSKAEMKAHRSRVEMCHNQRGRAVAQMWTFPKKEHIEEGDEGKE